MHCFDTPCIIHRTKTVHDQMVPLLRERDSVTAINKSFVGAIVMTKYNARRYRIDEIDFNESPASTFTQSDGSQKSYADYMKERYALRTRDMKQPMLVSRPKDRDIRGGRVDSLKLIPEHCYVTGLDDSMRSNFQLMEAMAKYFRMAPQDRVESALNFANRLQTEKPKGGFTLSNQVSNRSTNSDKIPGRTVQAS